MCTFITLIAATDDADRLNSALATLDRRGQVRRAERIDTPGLRPLLTTLSRELGLKRLALMHHFYDKSPGIEPEIATRRRGGQVREAAEVLASMGDAVIHDFEIGAPSR